MTRGNYRHRRLLAALTAACLGSGSVTCLATVPYQGSSSDIQNIAVDCLGQKIEITFVRRSEKLRSGLQRLAVDGKPLAAAEIARANALLLGQNLSDVEFMGCRRTRQGDVRAWISLTPPITARNSNDLDRAKRFYVRGGKIEVHEHQPVD